MITDSLVEAVLARDVMTGHRIAKPVLWWHWFALACAYPAQVISAKEGCQCQEAIKPAPTRSFDLEASEALKA